MAAAARVRDDEWWVGTTVEYAIYHEYGTRFMAARPHFRVALERVMQRLGRDPRARAQLWRSLRSPGSQSMLRVIALMIEREVKLVVTEKRIIDTGNLRASYAEGPSFPAMAAASERASAGIKGRTRASGGRGGSGTRRRAG